MTRHILVIKLSALGDFVQNFGLMRAIRDHHPHDTITLLTTKPYAQMAEKSGYFDHIITDKRPKFFDIKGWASLKKQLKSLSLDCVYDLQNNDRSRLYHSVLMPRIVKRIGLEKRADKNNLAFYRHKEMLEKQANITHIEIDSMGWMHEYAQQFVLPDNYALIVPGCAPTRPEKRWSAQGYIQLCQSLNERDITPVLLGTKDEQEIINQIISSAPYCVDLCGKTSLYDIPYLAQNALISIGNDTGPMHMIGPTGCKSLVLFSGYIEPKRHAPLGGNVHTIQEKELSDLKSDKVIDTAFAFLPQN